MWRIRFLIALTAGLTALFLSFLATPALAGLLFPGAKFPAGDRPVSVAVADLDGDTVPDLVTANASSNDVSVLLGNGDGSFQAALTFATTGLSPRSVAVADLDGDLVPDLVTANRDSDDVSVLLGNGDGSFQAARGFAVFFSPSSVAVADLDGDTVPDLATATAGLFGRGVVIVLLGNGDGSFQATGAFAAGFYPLSVAAADLDGDMVPDLVTANGFGEDVSVLLGNGDGSFQAPRSFPAGSYPASVAVADLDGDTVPDLVTANLISDDVSVLLGNGDGSFQAPRSFPAGSYPASVAVADLDGDTVPDLVTANLISDDVSVLLGNGDGSFQATGAFAAGFSPHSVAVADLDGDTVPDLATANFDIPSGVSVLFGNGDGSFPAPLGFRAGARPTSVAVADLDGDTVPDLATANFGHPSGVSVLLGNGDGSFQAPLEFGAGARPVSVAVADLDGDTVPDLVTANRDSDDVSVLLGNGDGSFQAARAFATGDFTFSVAVADLDGDTVPDLVTANAYSDDVSVLLGNGDGSFQDARAFPAGFYPLSVAVADLDGDAVPDLATADLGFPWSVPGGVSVLLGNGDGSFQDARAFPAGFETVFVAVADLDGDRVPDLVTANASSNDVSVLLGNGDGSFQAAQAFEVGPRPGSVAVADLDGDRVLDVVAANSLYNNADVSVLLGNGDGSFQDALTFATAGLGPDSVVAADLDGDTVPDLVTTSGSLDVSVLLNQSSPPILAVDIDIKSGSCPNSWNRHSNGVLPVAVLGTEDFDVTQIDVSSVVISRADGVGGRVGPNEGPPGPHSVFDDVSTPFDGEACDCHAREGDGYDDLSMKFKTQDVVAALELGDLSGGDLPELVVSGTLLDGTPFAGSDCVRLVPPGTPSEGISVQANAPGAWIEVSPLDETLDGGGFCAFERSYPQTTEVTLTASPMHSGRFFLGWRVDGGPLITDGTVLLVVDAKHSLEAIYQMPPSCGLGAELALLLPPLMWMWRRPASGPRRGLT